MKNECYLESRLENNYYTWSLGPWLTVDLYWYIRTQMNFYMSTLVIKNDVRRDTYVCTICIFIEDKLKKKDGDNDKKKKSFFY